jgi:hypothetical protein
MITRAELIDRLRRFVTGQVSFEDLDRTFVWDYVNHADGMDLSGEDLDLLDSVHEWIEWTSRKPSAEEKAVGWHDVNEFSEWLLRALTRSGYL